MTKHLPVGSSGYTAIRDLAELDNISPPPADSIYAMTNIPELKPVSEPDTRPYFDIGGMAPS